LMLIRDVSHHPRDSGASNHWENRTLGILISLRGESLSFNPH
jgi:hypothetical protein